MAAATATYSCVCFRHMIVQTCVIRCIESPLAQNDSLQSIESYVLLLKHMFRHIEEFSARFEVVTDPTRDCNPSFDYWGCTYMV